eukprot:CAMPEP_0201883778 /NCGR_PEP_ID=MMETSP0902-20130614/16229_1 /ASSEMBLY_ACC=CAM_ASM_000551 /TAXON_ID=420261 /ORGANISM="Thalassiosira antarctica, Strain CCMP982" /LENGTH=420 /DNA_ID=CAMNT_0048412635 /DNA_START=66 /DNA_END=1328 /DNA_ORIENTATION=+
MIGCRIASTTACFALLSRSSGTHAFTITPTAVRLFKIYTNTFARRTTNTPGAMISSLYASQSDSTSETASAPPDNDGTPHQLYDNTLLSIQQCLAAFHQEQQQQRQTTQQGSSSSSQATKTTQSLSKIVFIDGSWYHKPDPTTGLLRNPSQEFTVGPRIPNARFLDIDAIATTQKLFPDENPKGLPHMMPPPKLFGLAMDAYNIRDEDHVIIYARRGALFTPRVWFLFVSMGHDPKKVHLMQGSLEDYMEEGGLVETHSLMGKDDNNEKDGDDPYCATMGERYSDCFDQGILNVTRLYHTYYSTTTPHYNLHVSSATNICGKEEVLDAVNCYLDDCDRNAEPKSAKKESGNTVILDTRGSGFARKGCMPSAIHLPYSKIATATNSLVIQPKAILEKLFEERGIDYLDPELKIILSCGSGV